MKMIPGSHFELVRCTSCGWEHIRNGFWCSRCGHRVEELFDDSDAT